MDQKTLDMIKYRKSLFIDAVEGKQKPGRIALACNDRTGKIFDMGYKLSDCFYDYDKMDDCVYGYHEKYEFDTYYDLGTRNLIKATDSLRIHPYVINDEKGYINHVDCHYMEDPLTGYREMIQKYPLNPSKYIYEELVPLVCTNFTGEEDKYQCMEESARAYYSLQQHGAERQRVYLEKYGVPKLAAAMSPRMPVEWIFNSRLRGIKGLSLDMRRCPDLLEEALDMLEEIFYREFVAAMNSYQESDNVIFALSWPMLAHTIMNPKQFERFYWKYAKKRWDYLAEKKLKVYIHIEGTILTFLDYLREIQANLAGIMIEQDDPKVIKEALPNITLCGGFPSTLLGRGTKEQCLDKAKQMLEDLAYDGRYIYTTDKMISYANDVKEENQLAVLDFFKKYGMFR